MRLVLLIFLTVFGFQSIYGQRNKLRMVELVEKENAEIETHSVETEDGYSLTMFRIPSKNPNAQPVLVLSGLIFSSDDWVILGKKSLGFSLSSQFDVWFGNNRGNVYSNKHKTFSTWSSAFWDFSLDDLGQKDLPSMIDYVLNTTQQSQILFVGHSQGASQLLIMNSEKPEYVHKVKASVFVAPVVYVKHITSDKVKGLTKLGALLQPILPNWNFFPRGGAYNQFMRVLCQPHSPFWQICLRTEIFPYYGTDWKGIDPKTLPNIMQSYPSGSSTKPFYQLSQLYRAEGNHFRKYDYGKKKNVQMYSSEAPPEYDLQKTTNPIYIIHGGNDAAADPQDVELLKNALPNVKNSSLIIEYNYVDWFWARDIDQTNKVILDWLAEN